MVSFSQGSGIFFMCKFSKRAVCFTGHRSQKLSWRFNEKDKRCKVMKNTLRKEIINAIENGFKTFYCGMAIGFDMIAAETVLDLKKKYKDIKLIGALPCRTQDAKWLDREKKRYKKLLKRLDGIRCIYDEYIGAECMFERNRFMVDNSRLLIALYNGTGGGTKSTIDYARSKGLKIVIIEPL